MAASLAIALKSLFPVLGCLVAGIVDTIAIDGVPLREELITPLMAATMIDSSIHVFIIWLLLGCLQGIELDYILWAVLLVCFRRTETEQWRKSSLLTARILSLALGRLMLGTLIYILVTNGSPFRRGAFTLWMSATLFDYFVIVVDLQFFSLSSQDPVYLVLFSSHNRYFQGIPESVS